MINTAIKAAKAAGKISKEERNNIHKIKPKIDASLVTEVDILCENEIKRIISRKYPDHGFICEEEGVNNQDADYVWVIDPLDGTHNYIFGSPIFGVSIALAYKKKFIAGVAYFPVLNQLFTGEKGRGSFLNGKKLEVSNRNLSESAVSLSSGDIKRGPERFLNIANNIIQKSFDVRMIGSATYNISHVATKRFDVMVSGSCKIWDAAAGSVIVEEAGGLVTDFEGKPITIDSKNCLATNKINHKKILDLLK